METGHIGWVGMQVMESGLLGSVPTYQLEKVIESINHGLLLPGWLRLQCEHEVPTRGTCVLLAA